jgi:glycosyltransferase involved in cell wall biosynthesis
MNRPAVSVIIPTYNRENLLPRALDSIEAQTFGDWEIVLVDDGSTDHSADLAAPYALRLGERFRYLHQQNRGSSAARNRGIDSCRGRFVAFLDSDDEFLPTKLERQLVLFEQRPDLGLVYCDYSFVDLDGVRTESAFDTKLRLARTVPCQAIGLGCFVCTESLFDSLLRGYFIATIAGMVRREVLGATVRFPEGLAYAEEWLFYLMVAKACRAGFVDEPLALHHFVPGSLARSDKIANTLGSYRVLQAIDASFADLTYAQRKTVHRNLAATCRQLGYEAQKAGRARDSLGFFVEALRYELSAAAVRGLLASAARALTVIARGGRRLFGTSST